MCAARGISTSDRATPIAVDHLVVTSTLLQRHRSHQLQWGLGVSGTYSCMPEREKCTTCAGVKGRPGGVRHRSRRGGHHRRRGRRRGDAVRPSCKSRAQTNEETAHPGDADENHARLEREELIRDDEVFVHEALEHCARDIFNNGELAWRPPHALTGSWAHKRSTETQPSS